MNSKICEHQRPAARAVMQEDLKKKNYSYLHQLHIMADPNYDDCKVLLELDEHYCCHRCNSYYVM